MALVSEDGFATARDLIWKLQKRPLRDESRKFVESASSFIQQRSAANPPQDPSACTPEALEKELLALDEQLSALDREHAAVRHQLKTKGQRYAGLMSEYDEQLRRYRSFIEDEKNIVFPKDARRRQLWGALRNLLLVACFVFLICVAATLLLIIIGVI